MLPQGTNVSKTTDLMRLERVLLSNARTRTLAGKDYVVVDAVILREGILAGSHGPLFYPEREVTSNAGMWNGIPVTAGHPMKRIDGTDQPVSARHPEVAQAYQIGTLYNDRIENGQRRVECWISVSDANRIDPRIVPAVLRGDPTNVSTGIFSERVPADPTNNRWNGRSFTHSVQNIRADHLAILMDEDGACSVRDGCGINVNSTSLDIENIMDKAQLITWLVTNCSCWKGEAAKTTLNSLDEVTLNGLKTQSEKASKLELTVNTLKEVGTLVGATKDTDLNGLVDLVKTATTNATSMAAGADDKPGSKDSKSSGAKNTTMKKGAKKKNGYEGEQDDDSDAQEKKTGKGPAGPNTNKKGMPESASKGTDRENGNDELGNEDDGHGRGVETDELEPMDEAHDGTDGTDRTGKMGKAKKTMTKNAVLEVLRGLTEEEYLGAAPVGIQQTLNSAKEVVEKEKISIINQLTVNIKDQGLRKAKILKYREKTLPELREFLEAVTLNSAGANGVQGAVGAKASEETFLANFFSSTGTPNGHTGHASDDQVINRSMPLYPTLEEYDLANS